MGGGLRRRLGWGAFCACLAPVLVAGWMAVSGSPAWQEQFLAQWGRLLPVLLVGGFVGGAAWARSLHSLARAAVSRWRKRTAPPLPDASQVSLALSELDRQAWAGQVAGLRRRNVGLIALGVGAACLPLPLAEFFAGRLAEGPVTGVWPFTLALSLVALWQFRFLLLGGRRAARAAASSLARWVPRATLRDAPLGGELVLQSGSVVEVFAGRHLRLSLDLGALPIRSLARGDQDAALFSPVSHELGGGGASRGLDLTAGPDADGLPVSVWLDPVLASQVLALVHAGGSVRARKLTVTVPLDRRTPDTVARVVAALDRLSQLIASRGALEPSARVLHALALACSDADRRRLLEAAAQTPWADAVLSAWVADPEAPAPSRGDAWVLWAARSPTQARTALDAARERRDLPLLRGVLGAVPQGPAIAGAVGRSVDLAQLLVDQLAQQAAGALAVEEPGGGGGGLSLEEHGPGGQLSVTPES